MTIPDCPVLTERHGGAPTKHNMVSEAGYCKACRPRGLASVSGPPDLCEQKHKGHRYCNGCRDYTDDWQQCQWYVATDEGRWTHFGFCTNKAKELHHMQHRFFKTKVWRWVCGTHTPDAFAKRKAKKQAKYQEWKDEFDRRIQRADDQQDYEEILVDIAGWMAKNAELVA